MARGRAFRRHQDRLAKRRAYNHLVYRWGIEDPTPAAIGYVASTHCCACSCWMCGNQRQGHGLTWPEIRAAVFEKQQRREAGER